MITNITQQIEKLACKSRLFYRLSMQYYKNMVKREVNLAGINENDHVLVVGGGPCPHSGILIHQLTGAKVTVIDNIESCVACSTKLIQRLGIADSVKVVLGDGGTIPPHRYTVIHIAMQITPKEAIIKRFMATASYGTRILVRLPKETLAGMYSNASPKTISNYKKVEHGNFTNVNSTALYTVSKAYEKQVA